MKHLGVLIGLCAWTSAAGLPAFVPALVAQPRPNVVVIYTDDQGYGDMSALNPAAKFRTPNMDRMAREGLLFTDAHCADTVCTPSRYALLTGRYAWRTSLKRGVLEADGDCLIAGGRMTVASLLKAQGYHTAMFGKWHLLMQFPGERGMRDWSQPITDGPLEKGFEYFHGIAASMNYGVLTFIENNRVTEVPSLWTRKKDDPAKGTFRFMPPYDREPRGSGDVEVAPSFRDDACLETFTRKAVEYIAGVAGEAKSGRPFFIYLALNSPHLPHCPTGEFTGKSGVGAYGDFMLETDFRVGQLLDALDRHGLSKNTLLLLTSDNGAETNYRERITQYQHYSNGVLKGGKRDIYEGGHRVPFVVRWPGVVAPGRRSDEPVCQVDLLATLADILGKKLPDNAGEDSFSLLPVFKGDDHPRPLRAPIIHHSASGYFAVREGRWKLNMFRGSGGSLEPRYVTPKAGEPPFELYDLQNDLGETANVYARHPDVVERLKSTITRLVLEGRSTPGSPQQNDGPAYWNGLTWLPQSGAAEKGRKAAAGEHRRVKSEDPSRGNGFRGTGKELP